MNKSSVRSPKAKYSVRFNYSKPIKGIGSTSGYTCDDVEKESEQFQHYIKMAERNNVDVSVVIKENKATYPKFEWEVIENYVHGKSGGKRPGTGRPKGEPTATISRRVKAKYKADLEVLIDEVIENYTNKREGKEN